MIWGEKQAYSPPMSNIADLLEAQSDKLDTSRDSDERKIKMIYFEFAMNMCINLVNSVHFLQLILIRGLNISVFTHFIIGRTAFSAVNKLYIDVSRFLKFREFMASL